MTCLTDTVVSRRLRPFLCLLVLLAATVWTSPARAQYALYYEGFGQWTVTCQRNMTSEEVTCQASAPQAGLDAASAQRSVLTVKEPLDGFYEIHVQLRGPPDPGLPLGVVIGGYTSGVEQPDRFGDKTWVGSEAQPMVEAMRNTEAFVLVRTGRKEVIPLDGFGPALARLRERNRTLGLVKPTP